MYDFNDYLNNKDQLIEKMEKVKIKVKELEELDFDVKETIMKIDSAIKIVQNDKISVVLVGAFSDGKTSVAAGWLNEKLENMKISSDESSDEIICYKPSSIPDGCCIVDTPGLFGDKLGSDEDGSIISLSEKTKKYISEANLILYVVTAKNPIKDSHKTCIKWILKDLNKLSSTIFVINRMDDVADVTDEVDFAKQKQIKTNNLRGKLLECGLNESEAQGVKVACISAAPGGQGIEIWKAHREEYLKRSHLGALENMTNSILKNSKKDLIAKTGCDILNDEVNKILENLNIKEAQILNAYIPEMQVSLDRNEKDLEALKKKMMRSRSDMKSELRGLKKRKINKIRAASIENFKEVMEDEVGIISGREGAELNSEINEIFERYVEQYSGWTKGLANKFQTEYNNQNTAIEALLKKGAKGAATGLGKTATLGTNALKSGIFAGRDALGKIGIVVKFKPWQVTKIANFASKALPVIGAGIDIASNVIENLTEQKRNQEFEKNKDEIKKSIESVFDEIFQMIDDKDEFIDKFAPSYRELEKQLKEEKSEINYQKVLAEKYKIWQKEMLADDFRIA